MRFKVLLGMRRATRRDGYNKVDTLGWDDKEGMRQATDNETRQAADKVDASGRRGGGRFDRPWSRSDVQFHGANPGTTMWTSRATEEVDALGEE